jgi:electron transfer flavoprotein beta subunit
MESAVAAPARGLTDNGCRIARALVRCVDVKILVPSSASPIPTTRTRSRSPPAARVDTTGLEWKPNPFDEYALEAALRLTENGKAPKQRLGEVVVVTLGPKECEHDAARRARDGRRSRDPRRDDRRALDGRLVALALKSIVLPRSPTWSCSASKRSTVTATRWGQRLAEHLDWPMATFAATIREEAGALLVGREVDGGVLTLRVRLPALVTVDLRIVAPTSVYSLHTMPRRTNTPKACASLPCPRSWRQKKKPLDVKPLAELAPGVTLSTKSLKFERPASRSAGIKVKDVTELVDKLMNVSKVL